MLPTEPQSYEQKKEFKEFDRAVSTKSPLMGLLEWEQKALTGLDTDLSDLAVKLGPLLEQPTTDKEPSEARNTHGSEFAKQYQANIEKIERLCNVVKDLIRRCDV